MTSCCCLHVAAGTVLVEQNVISLCGLTVCLGGGVPRGAFSKIYELENKWSNLGSILKVNLDLLPVLLEVYCVSGLFRLEDRVAYAGG